MKAKRLDFIKVYSWAAARLGGMCAPETVAFSIIYSYDENGKDCFISYKTFAEWSGRTKRTMMTAIKRLQDAGLIEVYNKDSHNLQTETNLYVPTRKAEEWREMWERENKSSNKSEVK